MSAETGNLFAAAAARVGANTPLAERLRPRSLDELVGQHELIGPGTPLRALIERGDVPSMILWGPPGSGKTTLARLLAQYINAAFESVAAVMSGVKELRAAVDRAKQRRGQHGQRSVLFIDEIHRFNKAQQDALLPHVESGLLILIGATTENPSFEVNAALLSRVQVFVLESLPEADLRALLQRALTDSERGLGQLGLQADASVLDALTQRSHGDARVALGNLELAAQFAKQRGSAAIEPADLAALARHAPLSYDKTGEEHYNVVSAFIKSMRGSDPDAAIYWMVRMLEGGEDPHFILRRMLIFASEDIGNADPRALEVAVNAQKAFDVVGLPEGVLPLTQAASYLALAPKSNAVIAAYGAARKDVRTHGALAVPKHLRNPETGLMRELGYGKGYKYPHNFEGHYVAERYLPERLATHRYYRPSDQGEERALGEHLAALDAARQSHHGDPEGGE